MRPGFTLIELLVVIAIIALLIGILLPALGRARQMGWQSVSLSNTRQINIAQTQYVVDHDELPFKESYRGASRGGWCTWSFGGKNNNDYWRTRSSGLFDEAAFGRPLNPYVHGDIELLRPDGWQDDPYREAPPSDNYRERLQLEAFRSPGDKVTYQQQWPRPTNSLSSYEDVGTSYHTNMKWFDYMREQTGGDFWAAFEQGTARLRLASGFNPSKFVWIHDETADIVANDSSGEGIIGEFGDRNKSVMAFMDGHSEYVVVEPNTFRTDDYTFVFELAGDEPPG
ncbi:MAG: prepilin-type N-terminal cleavage/methylation domain-containing protein [Planctomycetota bacterium]